MVAPGLLVIGASQWKYASIYAQNISNFDVTIISRSGMRVDEVDDSMLFATEFFSDVVIHLGTNNLICGELPEQVVEKHERLIKLIRARNPEVRLYLSSVLERGTNRYNVHSQFEVTRIERMNGRIRRLNALLKNLAQRRKVEYIENWKAFEATAADPCLQLLSRDGLHLNPRGVNCLIGNVISVCLKTRSQCFSSPAFSSSAQLVAISTSSSSVERHYISPSYSNFYPVISSRPVHASSGSTTVSYSAALLSSISSNSSQQIPISNIPSAPFHNPSSPITLLRTPTFTVKRKTTIEQHRKRKPATLPKPSSFSIDLSNRWSVLASMSDSSEAMDHLKSPKCTSGLSQKPKVMSQKSLKTPSLPNQVESLSKTSNTTFKAKITQKSLPKSHPSRKPKLISKKSCPKLPSNSCEIDYLNKISTTFLKVGFNNDSFPIHPFSNKFNTSSSTSRTPSSWTYIPGASTSTINNTTHTTCKMCGTLKQEGHLCRNFCRNELFTGILNGGTTEVGITHKSIYPRKCELCNKMYCNKSSFYQHKSRCGKLHNPISYPRVCSQCKVSYSNKNNYSRHKKNCTGNSSKYITCPHSECDMKFQSHSVMINHLESVHQDDISVKNHIFKNMAEFNSWKSEQSQEHHMSVVKHCGEHMSGCNKMQYFICKFDNHHKNDKIFNKTSRRRKFGCMPNTNCIARMLVKESETGIFVKYINSHNHKNEFKNVKFYQWDKKTKFQINSLLEQSVPARKIQEQLQPIKTDLQDIPPIKEYFITSSQINKMRYELGSKKHLNKDDAIAVHLLVNSMKDESKDSILVYKPLGGYTEIGDSSLDLLAHSSETFVLGIQNKLQLTEMVSGCNKILCIDSTHGTNQYKFHLINLIVPDEYGVGYPIAHFITSHLDEEILTLSLKSIKSRFPDLNVNAVMTDGDEALSNAVQRVFGDNTIHLLCSWHVKRNWQKNLHHKVKNNDLMIEINACLESLMDEKNEVAFNIMLETFLDKYSNSASSFIRYFRDYYCCKKEKWAMCYRNFPHASTDTNMFVETYHNKLKTHYLNRKVNRRLDDLVQVILSIHKTIHLGLTYKRMTQVPPLGFGNRYGSDHSKGLKITDEDIIPISDDKVWNVRSQSDPSVMYCVTNVSLNCLHPDLCFVKCHELSCQDLCCHMYHCSCPNNYTLCKHVHKVHSFIIRNAPISRHPMDSNLFNSPPNKLFMEAPHFNHHKEEHSKEKNLLSINQLLNRLRTLTQDCRSEILPYVCNSLKLLVEKCEGAPQSDNSTLTPLIMETQRIPPNAKFSPQLKLYQTMKKRRATVHRFKKTDPSKKIEIKKSLLQYKEVQSFTTPIGDGVSPLAHVCQVGAFSIKINEIKSLDFHISEEEVERIKRVSPDFQRGWLYDTIIIAFLWRITASDKSVYIVDPAISQCVTGKIPLQRQVDFFDKLDHFNITKIIIPLNINNSHWMLIVARPNEKKIDFYDPASNIMKDAYHSATSRWIQILNHKFGGKVTDWEVLVPQHSIQQDSHNCGVFISWYAERVLRGESTTQSSFNPDRYRKYMHDVITGLATI